MITPLLAMNIALCCLLLLIILMCLSYSFIFFFQAEDGIRDLVRSRGLGDVYKRQGVNHVPMLGHSTLPAENEVIQNPFQGLVDQPKESVSYTHLTLPTSDLV